MFRCTPAFALGVIVALAACPALAADQSVHQLVTVQPISEAAAFVGVFETRSLNTVSASVKHGDGITDRPVTSKAGDDQSTSLVAAAVQLASGPSGVLVPVTLGPYFVTLCGDTQHQENRHGHCFRRMDDV
jgi:hypothetical protein